MRPALPEDCLGVTVHFKSDGFPLFLWSSEDVEVLPDGEVVASLGNGKTLVIGRQDGGETPYLDPQYLPTPLAPNSCQTILSGHYEADMSVSRGHFMVRSWPGGVVLVNGVPKRGGGIRPPLNGTWLIAPECRKLQPGEELPISRGTAVEIQLPNRTRIEIAAD